jgi:hypothetical protein
MGLAAKRLQNLQVNQPPNTNRWFENYERQGIAMLQKTNGAEITCKDHLTWKKRRLERLRNGSGDQDAGK